MKARILCQTNQKGGVGKTTTTLALAQVYASRDRDVLVVDLDPNAHATSLLLPRDARLTKTSLDLLQGRTDGVIVETGHPRIHLVPATSALCEFESKFSREPHKSLVLEKALTRLLQGKNYAMVLLDTPSTVGALQFNAVTASDMVIVPVVPEYLALNGFNNLLVSLRAVRDKLKKHLKYFVLFTMAQPNVPSQKRILEWADAKIKNIHFATQILYDAKFLEATAGAVNIVSEYPDSDGARGYAALADEIERALEAGDQP